MLDYVILYVLFLLLFIFVPLYILYQLMFLSKEKQIKTYCASFQTSHHNPKHDSSE